jgi:hypothetical protein
MDTSRRSRSSIIAPAIGFGDRLGGGRGIGPGAAPRPAGWTHAGRGQPSELLASAEQLLRRICVVGVSSPLLGLRALVAELVWEANTGAGA